VNSRGAESSGQGTYNSSSSSSTLRFNEPAVLRTTVKPINLQGATQNDDRIETVEGVATS